jgi:Xaa-Pro aminopeptidase
MTAREHAPYASRMGRVRDRLAELGIDVALLSIGADLPWLTGYEAMPLERLTMLVLPRDGEATLVVPKLEAPRVVPRPEAFRIETWTDTDDPVRIVTRLCAEAVPGGPQLVAIGDRTWGRFVLDLQDALPGARFLRANAVIGPLRRVKDPIEVEALRAAAHAVDAVVEEMRGRPFAGRTEVDVSREFGNRILEHGHDVVNFAIVGSGPNGASPHHDASSRVIERGDAVVCDFGGAMDGYCSDITRMFVVGRPPEGWSDAYEVLRAAQEAGVQAATAGTPCESVDAAARAVIDEAGYGEYFIHRTGHGIGLEAHEDPYMVAGNHLLLAPGHAFSVEPGIYVPGRWGMRLEDIVVATPEGPDRLNLAPRDPIVVD